MFGNWLKTTILMAGIVALFGVVGAAIGGANGMLLALLLGGAMNLFAYWFSDAMVLRMYNAREVDAASAPQFYGVVQELSQRAGLPMPRVYLIDEAQPNAFATGRNPEHAAVAATTGILRILSREELMGVMAHELSHVKNRDILISSIAATVAGAITYLAHMAQWAAMFGGGRDREEEGGGLLGMLVMAIVAPIAAMLIQMAISRSREYDADKGGALVTGNPLYLANALRKLEMANRQIPMEEATPASAHMFTVNPLTGGGLMSLFSTHPPVEERIRRLESMVYGQRG